MQRGKCGSNPTDHCCYVNGKTCPFLRTTDQRTRAEDGFYWKCALRAKLGSWAEVHTHHLYLKYVKPRWEEIGMEDCGDYPVPGKVCRTCGKQG